MRILILFLLGVGIFACQSSPEICPNKKLLTYPLGDSLPVFNLSNGTVALSHSLDSLFELELGNTEKTCYFYLKDSLFTPCRFDPWEINLFLQVHMRPRGLYEVLINEAGQILAEGELIEISDLDSAWKKNVLNYGIDVKLSHQPDRAFLLLRFSKNTPTDSLIKVISIIHKSHNSIIQEVLGKKHPVPFCDMPTDSVKTVMEDFPLNIFVSWRSFPETPPPPPAGLPEEL